MIISMDYVITLKSKLNSLSLPYNLIYSYFISNHTKTEDKFYEHQEKFKNINNMIKTFQDAFYNCKVIFD